MPIVSVLVGEEEATLRAGRFLFDRGFYVQSVVFPAVPHGAGVLRMQVNANHSVGGHRRVARRAGRAGANDVAAGPDAAVIPFPDPDGRRAAIPA